LFLEESATKALAMLDTVNDDLAAQRAQLFSAAASEYQETQIAYFAYEMPVRIWHWTNFLCISVLIVTGILIGSPPPSIGGEASDHFLFGYIRFAHFAAAQIFAWGFLGRVAFAFIGNSISREIFIVPVWSREFWQGYYRTVRWYAFLEKRPNRFIGHNPVARLMMFCAFVAPCFIMIATGVALYVEPLGMDNPLRIVSDVVFAITGGSLQTHVFHHLTMWILVSFIIIHVYAAIREEIMSRQSMISTMISGWRMFKD
jgi:Ni/Fe-hydrogenase 1 B-type cytochrome subunit